MENWLVSGIFSKTEQWSGHNVLWIHKGWRKTPRVSFNKRCIFKISSIKTLGICDTKKLLRVLSYSAYRADNFPPYSFRNVSAVDDLAAFPLTTLQSQLYMNHSGNCLFLNRDVYLWMPSDTPMNCTARAVHMTRLSLLMYVFIGWYNISKNERWYM